ncbi:hypothetical protein ACFFGV_06245 [Pontibacillus salicampi]|uniref:Uncharacterized protein n=1 Tax=Pontibacillus salicampi TaxID=1449801 RepID=A0ABV6LLC8_9BACI
MGLAAKEWKMYQDGVSKQEFEKSWVDVMDRLQIVEDKISRKADEVVLTMVLSHRKELEKLHEEIQLLQQEVNTIQKDNNDSYSNLGFRKEKKEVKNLWRLWFKK